MVLNRGIKAFSILLLALFLLQPVTASYASDGDVAEPLTKQFPGLSQLGDRASQLADFTEKADDRLAQLGDSEILQERLSVLENKVQNMRQKVAALGLPEDWYVDRLILYSNQFGLLRKDLIEIQVELTARQMEVEKIRTRYHEESGFWKAWGQDLKKQGVKVPEYTVTRNTDQLAQLDTHIVSVIEKLLPLQEQNSTLERNVLEEMDHFTQALDRLRKATFKKNAHSFFADEFYESLEPSLLGALRAGARSALDLEVETIKRNSWAYLLSLLTFILIAVGIKKHRELFVAAKEWQFVLFHPWAAGSFVAAVSFGNFLPAAPALVKFVIMIVGVSAATTLAVALLENRRQSRVLALAASFLLLTTFLRLIALPQPLFRLYIALLALVAIPLLGHQIQLARELGQDKGGRFFSGLLRIGALVLILSLGGQVAGYVNFSSWLLQAAFETGMVFLFAHMALRLGEGAIAYMLSWENLARRKFLKKYHQEVRDRLNFFLKVLVLFYALLNLLPVWRLFASLSEAWSYLAEFGFNIGDVRVTLQMVGFAIVTLYISIQISWLLQALCETQVFYRKSVDRGVRDAIKKLVHYGVVLVGFLVALSALGMSLQHFIVILGALGVGIGFGLQDIVNNFLSGIILLFERPIKVGDGILVDGEYGTVKYIGLRSTIVETLDHSELIVPNAQMISQKVTNWTLSNRRVRVVMRVGVAYGSDVKRVMMILNEVSTTHQEVLDDPAPSPIFTAFGDSSLNFELRVWIANIDIRPRVMSELLQLVDARFREAGVEIPFPQRDLHLRSVDGHIVDKLKPT